jgi:hypothetical protein
MPALETRNHRVLVNDQRFNARVAGEPCAAWLMR